jgi:heptosyltransferase-2
MIWHLPHIRAIAAHVGSPITLVAKPRSAAAQIFAAEQTVREVILLDRNPENRRGRHDGPLGLLRLVQALHLRRFDAVYLLHQSETLAFVTWLARIPARFGYGTPLQRPWLNRPPFLSRTQLRVNWFEQASAWLVAAGIPMQEGEPLLPVLPDARLAVTRRLGEALGPLVTIGIGSSDLYKQWGAERFADLIRLLLRAGWPRFVLVGGPPQAALAADILRRLGETGTSVAVSVDWPLTEVAALLERSAFYVGNDTGFLNMAGAVGTRAFGLFGATRPFHHSKQIMAISPPDGRLSHDGGMAGITAEHAMAVIQTDRHPAGAALEEQPRRMASAVAVQSQGQADA